MFLVFITLKDCFPCLDDNLCIENNRFCNMKKDCHDNSDEKNCGECLHIS